MLLSRYSNIEYVMKMDADEGIFLIYKAIENNEKEKLYQKWLHDSARYEMSLDEYIEAHIPYRKSTVEEKEDILKRFGGA